MTFIQAIGQSVKVFDPGSRVTNQSWRDNQHCQNRKLFPTTSLDSMTQKAMVLHHYTINTSILTGDITSQSQPVDSIGQSRQDHTTEQVFPVSKSCMFYLTKETTVSLLIPQLVPWHEQQHITKPFEKWHLKKTRSS